MNEELLKYFNGDTLASQVWLNKYALKDSDDNVYETTPDEMHRRLSKEIARIESGYPKAFMEEDIYEVLKDFKYIIPQGGPMTGVGNNYQVASLSNCFVIGNNGESDSYGGIMKIDQEQVQLMKRRGGVGHDLSHIRPKGSPVKNSALTSTGIVPFMERYSNSTREVAQDGRRGALMLSVSINHPDSEDFIDAKMEQGKVTGANVSVKIDDSFMESVKAKEKYVQKYPIFSDSPKYSREVEAEKLWKKIIHNAWKSAEPGILFWDTIINESIPDCYTDLGFKTVSTNPCFRGDVKILTEQGYKTFESLKDKETNFINHKGNSVKGTVWSNGEKQVFEMILSMYPRIFCTADHIFMNSKGEEKTARDIVGDRIMPHYTLNKEISYYTKLGFIQGDGSLTRLNSKSHLGLEVHIGEDDSDILNLFGYDRGEEGNRTFYTTEFTEDLKRLGFDSKILPERGFPTTYNGWKRDEKTMFLKGLYSANGCIIKGHRVSFKSTSKVLIDQLTTALKELGIDSYFTTNKAKEIQFENGLYECRESYDLNISKYSEVLKFAKIVGFVHKYKMKDLESLILLKAPLVRNLKPAGKSEVFDFNLQDDTHWGIVEGVVAHNCGEIPLCPYDSCRLLAINLYSYVNNPFTDKAEFDFELFKKHTNMAQRIMDDIVDLEIEKIDTIIEKIKQDPEDEEVKRIEFNLWEKIKEKTLQGRRTGVGITAEGDMLAALGFKYGTPEATVFCEEVHKTLALSAYGASVEMAEERGKFPIYEAKKEENNPMILRIKEADPQLYDKMVLHGRRNIALLTIAPTGTTSIMTQTTSGIEPVFLPVYKRRRKVNPNDKNVRIDFVDEVGDSWEEYTVFHHKFKTWLEVKGYDTEEVSEMSQEGLNEIVAKSPYHEATANDVNWLEKVKMQGAVQKWVDHSISVTVNVPNDATEELIGQIYMTGWEEGCKGITTYRDGSRSGVLVADTKPEEITTFHDNHAPARPKSLDAKLIRFNNNKEKWIAFVGLMDNKPYEIFTGLLDDIKIPLKIEEGKITKKRDENGIKSYVFEYEDGEEEIGKVFNKDFWNYGKLVSGILRHGMPLIHAVALIKDLKFPEDHINTWINGVARTLKKFIPDGKAEGLKCNDCGGTNVVYEEGCSTCKDCGSSLCS